MSNIRAWSFSRLQVGESCGLWTKLAYLDRIPASPRPQLPAGEEYPDERGTRIHTDAEHFVRGKSELTPELARHFQPEFMKLRTLHAQGRVVLEDSWNFDDAWNPLEPLPPFPSGQWPRSFAEAFYKIWVRIKVDVCVFLNPTHAVAIDHKTGKRYGNEVKHAQQLQLYMLAVLLRYPKVQNVDTEAWYLDQNQLAHMRFSRAQGLRFLKSFNQRGIAFTSMTDFSAKPNMHTCRFCPYKTGALGRGVMGTGHCDKNPV